MDKNNKVMLQAFKDVLCGSTNDAVRRISRLSPEQLDTLFDASSKLSLIAEVNKNSASAKSESPRGVSYSISDSLAAAKYHGCGSGTITVVDDVLVDMDYTDEKGDVLDDQNILLCRDAGRVLFKSDDGREVKYKANFSVGSACLFNI